MSPYSDPRDKRVFVPKKTGGVALNFAHPVSWWIVITMAVIPVLIVVGVTLAYLIG